MTESLCCIAVINTTLQISNTSQKKKKKKKNSLQMKVQDWVASLGNSPK